ncbi:MAG: NADH-quinone oxidoreductase subunit NuoH [Spirochaetia bacterium]|nr:NADH-quinone oxidoreductase subunit NuoH [Spirochaetia bacterium]
MTEIYEHIAGKISEITGVIDPFSIILILIFTALLFAGFISLFAGITSVVERKIAGRVQSRIGPNYIFFRGFFQFVADGIKILQKEDIIPDGADKILFRTAPYIIFAAVFLAFASIPVGMNLIAADLNTGILYIMAVSSFNVIGILMAGWGSNNKYSMLGGFRSAAQIISYEIPSALSALTVILLAGSLSMQEIIINQGVWPWEWHIASSPFTVIAFFIMFTALIAEGNRTPFDLPESESELVSGYNTEYSGIRFLIFFFAEWANLYVISAILSSLFLGGWNSPFHEGFTIGSVFIEATGIGILFFKSIFLTFLIIMLRWTLPRLRIDQLMSLSWKYLTPFSFLSITGVLFWMVLFPEGLPAVQYSITGFFILLFLLFIYRVIAVNLIKMKANIGTTTTR